MLYYISYIDFFFMLWNNYKSIRKIFQELFGKPRNYEWQNNLNVDTSESIFVSFIWFII